MFACDKIIGGADMDEKWEKLKKWIEESNNIVFFGGAGVSTESGIPDFRSENGIFMTMNEYGFSPETILSHSFFMAKPDIFFNIIKRIYYILMRNLIKHIKH